MVPVAVDLPLSSSNVECAIQAAVRNGVPPDLVLALRSVEAGRAGAATRNGDGTYDFGEAAINSVKFPELAQRGYDPKRLVSDGCYAMDAKAFIVREHLVSSPAGTPLLERAARYHSKTPSYNRAYQEKLIPWLSAWACILYTNKQVSPDSPYAYAPQALFAVAAGVVSADMKVCGRILNSKGQP